MSLGFNCDIQKIIWSQKDKDAFIREGKNINEALILAINKKLKPSSAEVQAIIRRHYAWIKCSWTPTKESYIGLSQLYQTPEFKKFYDDVHPKLLQFLMEAIKIFAERELS